MWFEALLLLGAPLPPARPEGEDDESAPRGGAVAVAVAAAVSAAQPNRSCTCEDDNVDGTLKEVSSS